MRKLLLVALVLAGLASSSALADTATRSQGVVGDGVAAASSVNPVLVAAKGSGNTIRALASDDAGNLSLGGSDSVGAVASGRPFTISGVDSGSKVRRVLTNGSGVLYAGETISPVDSITPVYVTSNGTTNQTILAGLGGEKVYVAELLFKNSHTTLAHAVTVRSSSGSVVAAFFVAPQGTGALGGNGLAGYYRSFLGDGLTFTIDSGGSSTDVLVTGVVVQK